VTYDAAATIRTITGLTAGGSYTFTVAAVNANGTSAASPASAAVVPYSAPSAPTVPAVTPGDSSVTLNWNAPSSNGGSSITGYVITPYLGAVAQPATTFTGTATTGTVTGLTPGQPYTFTVAARGLLGTTVLYRVNAGGPAVTATDGGPNWSDDSAATNPLRNSGSTASVTATAGVAFDSTIPSGTPAALFSNERYDLGAKGDGGEMSWFFPVNSGATVKVRLYFANQCSCTSYVGGRQFDVALEGSTVLDHLDPVAAAGGDKTATMREFSVTSDGTVNIDFIHEQPDAPMINAIEIIQTGLPSAGPTSAASASATPNTSPTLNFPAPPAGQVGTAYSNQLTVTGGTSPFTWSVSAGALPAGLTLSSSGLLSGTPTTVGSSTFTVQVVDGSGQSATESVTLVVTDKPAAPAAPTATAGITSATVSWVAPANNGSAITGYVVTPYKAGVAQTPVSYDATATSRTLTGLTAGSSYTFTVAATNATGTSAASAQSTAVTPYALPGAPTISAATAGDSAATLTWTTPSSNGSAITGYVVTPYIGATAQPTQTFSAATTQTVTGLTAGTAYTFTVAAVNQAGTGPASAASSPVTPNNSPSLNFPAPPAGQVGTAYSNQLTVTGGTSPFTWSVSAGALPAGLTLSSSGLLSGTPTTVGSSTFTVQVVDGSGQSATESVTLVVTDKPAAPAAPTATAGITSATVSWVAPANNGSAITGYVVTPYKAGVAQTPVSYDATATSRTLTGLTAGSSYTFTVAATNATGTSAASAQSTAVTPYALPGAPTISAATAGDSAATLTWTTPSSNGSAITGYVVTPYIGATAQPTQTFSAATTQTVTGLTAGTAYTFTVAAVNQAGTGPASAASSPVTPNNSPSLNFPAPPAGQVGVAYSNQLTVTNGTAPFSWSVTTGALPAGLTLSSSGLLSGTPTTVGSSTFTVQVVDGSGQSATQSVTLVVTDTPAVPAAPTATAGITSATVSWVAPANNGSAITGYVVTPYKAGVAQTPVSYDASATSRTLSGLTAGSSYTFTVAATNATGTSAPSAQSNAVTPYATAISMSGLTPSFTLTGPPNSTITQNGAVTMTVTSNNGYSVTVQARTGSLTAATPGNSATIPIGSLQARESGSSLFQALSASSPLVVHQQNGPSGQGGDAISNDYRVQIPALPSDTYSVTLDYIAAAQ